MKPETIKERTAIGYVTTTTLNNTSCVTTALNMGLVTRARAYFCLGTLTSTASVNIGLFASATQTGTFTAITTGGTSPAVTAIVTDDSLNCLEISADLMPSGKPWLIAKATETASQNAVVTIILQGLDGDYPPARDNSTFTLTNDVVATAA